MSTLQPYQERVVEESNELRDKIDKLQEFMKTIIFNDLYFLDRLVLSSQLRVMKEYSRLLNKRIDRFK